MTTKKKIEANRSNAKKSTGPKTVAGKGSSKMNALKHGLTAETVVIRDEDPEEYNAMREEFVREFAPSTAFEAELVDRLAANIWRLRRVPVFEAAILNFESLEAQRDDACEIMKEHTWLPNDKSSPTLMGQPDASQEYHDAKEKLAIIDVARQSQESAVVRGFIRASSNADIMGKLLRYELGIVKMIETILRQLERGKTHEPQNQIADPKVIELKAQGDDG